jgi:hypothetical protein
MHALATLILAVGSQSTPAVARPAAATTPPLVLSGVWRGREIAGAVGVRYPMVTFGDARSSLAYEDSQGLSGGLSVRVESIVVRGSDVRFAVKGAQPRYYRGTWDGKAIKGTIASEASGGPALGTFELTPVVYDDSPRLPMTLMARRRPPPAPRATVGANVGSVVFDRNDDRDSEQQMATRLVGYRLSRVSGGAEVLESMMDTYSSHCSGQQEQGTPLFYGGASSTSAGDCDRLVSEMNRVVSVVNKAISEAEDDARRADVLPGVVRELRTGLNLDEGDWDRATDRLRTIQSEASRRRH